MADEEVLIKRIMPHNFETEKSVIGSMLTSKDAIVEAAGILSPDDFYGNTVFYSRQSLSLIRLVRM